MAVERPSLVVGNYLLGADTPSIAITVPFTIMARVVVAGNQNPPTNIGVFYAKTNPSIFAADQGLFFQVGSGAIRPFKFQLQVTGIAPAILPSLGDVPVGVPAHLTATFDGATCNYYLDGAFDSTSGGHAGVPNNAAGGPCILTRNDADNFGFPLGFDGSVEDVRWYNRILSVDEIRTIAALQGTDGVVRGLGARWPLRGIDGATTAGATDLSGNTNTLAPVGTTLFTDGLLREARRLP